MRLPSLLGPSSRRSQTVIGICLIVLTLFTAFAVSQALPRIQDESDADNLARRNASIEARQLQGAPWGLPWGIFGGGQSASSVQPAQPAITTPLPAAVTIVGNNQPQGPLGVIGQILPTVIAPLTAAVGGVAAPAASVVPLGNILPSVVNAVPSLLQPGGLPGLPTAVPNAQGGQPSANGGLVPAVQSLVSIVLGAGGNAGSLVPLSGITGVLNPLTSPAGGVLPVSQVTAVVGNGAPVINMPSQLPAMSIINNIPTVVSGLPSAIGLITALPANLPSILPTVIPNLSINPVVTNLNEVLGPVSVLLPLSSVLPVNISGLNAPQLPEDLTGAVPSILSSLAIVISQPAPPASAVGDVDSQATTPLDAAGAVSCTMVRIANGTPAFVLTACPTGVSPAAPQTTVSSVSYRAATSQLSSLVNSAGSPVSTREPVPSLQLPGGSSGGWYCAPDGSGMVPAGANNLPVVVITTVTAFVVPQPTGAGSGGDDSGGGESGNGSDGGSDNCDGSGNGNDNGNDNDNGDGNPGNAASTPCTIPGSGQPTVGAGSGSGSGSGNGSNSGSPTDPNDGSGAGTGSGNGSGGNGAGNNGGAPGNGGADNAGSGNAVSTPCTTDKNGQPTKSAGSVNGNENGNGNGNGNSSGNGAPNSPGNGGPASNPDEYGSSPATPTTTNPNDGLGSGNDSPTPGGNGGSGSGDPNAGPGGGSPANTAPKAAAEVFGWAHLGCFKDSPIRTLDCDPSNYFAGSMSNEKCIAHCASKGFRLAGTEYGKECWCGNAFQLAVRIPEEQCNEVCDGRSTDICGGDWAVTVYSASGQALSVSLDDDAGNGAGNGSDGSGSPSPLPAGPSIGAPAGPPPGTPAPLATLAPPPASPPQAPPQSQPSSAPVGISQPAPNPPPQPQIDVASLIKSILDALPKANPDGGYGSSLGASDSGASGNNGYVGPGNADNPNGGTGGASMMGSGPSNPEDGLMNYGMPKRDTASRSVKRSSIIGRRAVAKFDGVGYGNEADGYNGDYVAEKA
ncbi:hypothetical protein QIS74_08101 [Colletotrichum tabaci]|uniref:WSC domain-containing protein n=1 Tax=Colletotrichum tabaci TaxID=1209068 RepID=A0AAV9T733_9PEZI